MSLWFDRARASKAVDVPQVMLVDDDLHARYTTAELIRSEGYEVHSASGHESWLSLFQTCLSVPATWVSFVAALEPDVVVLDLGMKSDLGLLTLGEIRRHPLTTYIPVVVIGSADRYAEVDAALSMGASKALLRQGLREGLATALRGVIEQLAKECPPLLGDERPGIVLS